MKDTDIFEGKKLSDLLKDIHDTVLEKRKDIDGVIKELVNLIKPGADIGDVLMLTEQIKGLYEVSVKNDEQIIKVATVVQRVISADAYKNGEDGLETFLSQDERDMLIANAMNNFKVVDDKVKEIKVEKINAIAPNT